MAVQDASQWLSVLLEILLKLCDIRESDLSLEPDVNRLVSAPDVRKRKGNGLRRLKGPDVGTEEWGNLSDDLGGGSDSSAEDEYSSSDDSEEGVRLAWNHSLMCSVLFESAFLIFCSLLLYAHIISSSCVLVCIQTLCVFVTLLQWFY